MNKVNLLSYTDMSIRQPMSDFAKLPDEMTLKIMEYLQSSEICKIALVCKSFYIITQENLLWKVFCNQLNLKDQLQLKDDKQIYKDLYKEQYIKNQCEKLYIRYNLNGNPVNDLVFSLMPIVSLEINKIDFNEDPFVQIEAFKSKDGKQHYCRSVQSNTLYLIFIKTERQQSRIFQCKEKLVIGHYYYQEKTIQIEYTSQHAQSIIYLMSLSFQHEIFPLSNKSHSS